MKGLLAFFAGRDRYHYMIASGLAFGLLAGVLGVWGVISRDDGVLRFAFRTVAAPDDGWKLLFEDGFDGAKNTDPGDHWLPDGWYGLDGIGDTEIDPANVREYTTNVHGGQKALQLIGGQVADRFTSDAFDVPTGTYACSYRARGKGSLRHRSYSTGGWSTQTDFVEIDSDEWQRIPFTMPGNVRDYRLIFYASRTDAVRDHLQIDDVVCTKNAP